METKNVTTMKSAMNYGLILGIALVGFHLVQYLLDMYKPPTWINLLNYGIIIGGIVYGTIRFRTDELNGYISYGKAFGFGVLISLFASIIYGFYFYILTAIIDPGYMNALYTILEESYIDMGMDYDQIEMIMKQVKKFQTPLIMVFSTIFGFVLMGTIFSLITSIFIKKEEPLFDTTEE